MSVRSITKINKIPDMIKNLNGLNGKKINVGVLEGANSW